MSTDQQQPQAGEIEALKAHAALDAGTVTSLIAQNVQLEATVARQAEQIERLKEVIHDLDDGGHSDLLHKYLRPHCSTCDALAALEPGQ